MLIGVLGAMKVEVEELKNEMKSVSIEEISGIEFYKGRLWDKDVVVAVCGVGKVNSALSAQTMILRYEPDLIINTGVAGAYSARAEIGSVIIGDCSFQHDVDTTAVGDPKCMVSGVNMIKFPCSEEYVRLLEKAASLIGGIKVQVGTIATGDQFISDKNKAAAIAEEFSASAFEMETASIAQVCYINKVDFAVIRAISDNGNEDASFDFPKFVKTAADNSVRLLKSLFSLI